MPAIIDWKLDAIAIVDEIYDGLTEHGPDYKIAVKEFFKQKLSEPNVLDQVPSLNETSVDLLQTGQVVKFRAMVQDMPGLELYMDKYMVQKANGVIAYKAGIYKDVPSLCAGEKSVYNTDDFKAASRNVVYCVSVPCETQWVKKVHEDKNKCNVPELEISHGRSKRQLPEDIEMETDSAKSKMECSETDGHHMNITSEGHPSNVNRTENSATVQKKSTFSKEAYFPIPKMPHTACIVKLYNEENLKVDEVYDFIGILSLDPCLGNEGQLEAGADLEEEETAHNPPSSLVPRLHVLKYEEKDHCNPLFPNVIESSLDPQETRNCREFFLKVLTELLLGDALTAEFLLLHLISRAYFTDNLSVIGQFPLNISGITPQLQAANYVQFFTEFIQELVSQCYVFSVSLNNMNVQKFIPIKNHFAHRLESGLLQLPKQTHLILDETKLKEGRLETQGLKNVEHIVNLCIQQLVEMNFEFHTIKIEKEVPVLLLSEGATFFRNCSTRLHLSPQHCNIEKVTETIKSLLTEERIWEIRKYLTCAYLHESNMGDSMRKHVTEEFVTSRQSPGGMTRAQLHEYMLISRLIAKSCGEPEVTMSMWNATKALVQEKKNRLSQL